jgi:hypothetical protein
MRERGRPPYPELPPALAAHLRRVDLAAVTTETNLGTVLVVKAPVDTIAGLVGEIPIGIDHELHSRSTAPVIRMVTAFYDQPDEPLLFETFFNVSDPHQRREYELLATQAELPILFYDPALRLELGKRVAIRNGAEIAQIVQTADHLLASIPAERFDFDAAKQNVIDQIPFPEFPNR